MIPASLLPRYLAIALFLQPLLLYYFGTTNFGSYFRFSGAISGIVVLLALLFDRLFWKWRPLAKLLSLPPNIEGTWKATLVSQWVNPDSGATPPPIEAFFVIRQTSSSINVKMYTAESASTTTAATIKCEDGTYNIHGVYMNIPDFAHQHRSQIHHGGLLITVVEGTKITLKGRYWTARKTIGDLTCNEKVDGLFDSYQAASDAYATRSV